jgi:hypothetical protein
VPELHRIADDLEGHVWYTELLGRAVADVEAFVGRWAAFEDVVAGFSEPDDAASSL